SQQLMACYEIRIVIQFINEYKLWFLCISCSCLIGLTGEDKRLSLVLSFSVGSLLGDNSDNIAVQNGINKRKKRYGKEKLAENNYRDIKTRTIESVGYLNLLANALDNFSHGLAISTSFMASIKMGLLTTFTIIMHEIPHEFGDFAILLDCPKFTCGAFLNISLLNLMPKLLQEKDIRFFTLLGTRNQAISLATHSDWTRNRISFHGSTKWLSKGQLELPIDGLRPIVVMPSATCNTVAAIRQLTARRVRGLNGKRLE
ncbi:unnamed protein product, partial [Medioppia subpectinata]